MPLYDFRCLNIGCEHRFEEIRKSDDKTPVHCPRCGWLAEKIPSAANFRVHGANAKNGYSGGGGR